MGRVQDLVAIAADGGNVDRGLVPGRHGDRPHDRWGPSDYRRAAPSQQRPPDGLSGALGAAGALLPLRRRRCLQLSARRHEPSRWMARTHRKRPKRWRLLARQRQPSKRLVDEHLPTPGTASRPEHPKMPLCLPRPGQRPTGRQLLPRRRPANPGRHAPAVTGDLRYGAAAYGRCPRKEFLCLAWSLSIIVTFLAALD